MIKLGLPHEGVEDHCGDPSCNTLGEGEYNCRDLLGEVFPYAEAYVCGSIGFEGMLVGFNGIESIEPGANVSYASKGAFDIWLNQAFQDVYNPPDMVLVDTEEHRMLVKDAIEADLLPERLTCEFCAYCK